MKKIILSCILPILVISLSYTQDTKLIFPRAFAIAVDDMGWNIGNNCGNIDQNGPYRIGIDRKMGLKDYEALVEVGKATGVRIQGLFVMSEMDRENILAKYPTTTWQGSEWDNSKNVNQEQLDIMQFVTDNAAYLEFGLHGVGHEYWHEGEKKRAEWYCQQDDHPWPEESAQQHIQCFKDIMAQYGLTEENGHSFPESFVPCAYGYYWNPEGSYSTGKIMNDAGVKYVNTLFDYIRELNPPAEPNGGGFDNGVVVVNRINYGNPWYELASLPTTALAEQETDIIETHWSNWLAQDDFLQADVNKDWVAYYQMVQKSHDRYIAKNTEQFHAQWLYNKYTHINEVSDGNYSIDNSAMPDEYYSNQLLGNLVVKVKLTEGEHISHATLNNKPISCYYEEAGYGFIYLPTLEQKVHKLNYKVSKDQMPFYVYNSGTYNVYNVNESKKGKTIQLRIYGTQEVNIHCKEPQGITSDNPNIKLVSKTYNPEDQMLKLNIKALDIQGETGHITLKY